MPEPAVRERARTATAPPAPGDRAAMRLLLFVGGLIVALIAGFGIGRAVAPVGGTTTGGSNAMTGMTTPNPSTGPANDGHTHGGAGTVSAQQVSGLSLSGNGFTLVPESTSFAAGEGVPLRFRIVGPDRKPVTAFDVVHDKQLHLVVVRRDLTGYQHLHPTLAPDGTWSAPLALRQPGIWRAYADFAISASTAGGGRQLPLTLAVDLTVAGAYQPRPLPAPARESTVDKYTVTYEGTPQVGGTAPLLFRVFDNGAPVTGLEPYLGAFGHLVVLREGDMGYVHVHPEPQLIGGAVKFWLAAPSPGSYRMFFDFQVGGVVRTAEYTLVVK